MISKYTYKHLAWIDLESPTKQEIRSIMKEYNVHPLVADELLNPTLRPKVDLYDNLIYLILHFPTVSHKHDGYAGQEVDFIIGKNFLITTHYDLIDPLHEFSKVFEVNSILDKSNMADHAGFLFFYLMRELYGNLTDELDNTRYTLEKIKLKIFSGREVKMVKVISNTSRNLLNFKQAMQPHKEVLESFERAGEKFFPKEFSYYLSAMSGEYYKIYNRMESLKEALTELRETNDSLLTTKTNEIMKVLTIAASLMLPSALVASIFGMNTQAMPFIGSGSDFWIIVGIMASGTLLMFLYFKYKKWI
ncbi:MAG: magnesium/cobalt transporter CorA [Patescibacteria group bacterium]|nr:MAG: magnesium/cobalt transporter CorA [Patescibacteria group bacterium]